MKLENSKQIHRELAFQSLLAMGRAAPNPPVACVTVFQAAGHWHLLGGATERPGERHAEIVCLDSYHSFCKEKKISPQEGALKLYLSLEPCSHYGRTPPCTERILSEPNIKSVLAWERDPLLEKSGIEILKQKKYRARFVASSSQSQEPVTELGKTFLGGFFSRVNAESPRFHFKAACSQDGLMGLRGHKITISQARALSLGHLLRAKFDAVLLGMGTILSDQPRLDLRWGKECSASLNSWKFSHALNKESNNESIKKQKEDSKEAKDLFFQTLFRETARLSHTLSLNKNFEYQPDRIFVLGSYSSDPRITAFLALQKEISSLSMRETVFLVEESHWSQWHKALPSLNFYASVPDLSKKEEFAHALRTIMTRRGYNEVLIEGGAGIFRTLLSKENLQKKDRIYLLRSSKDFKDILKQNAVSHARPEELISIPSAMQAAPILESYNLGGDTLELRKMLV